MYYIICGIIVWVLSFLVVFIVLVFHLVTFGYSREWSRKNLISPLSKTFLRLAKIEMEIISLVDVPSEPVIYISNHTSPFDVFAVAAIAPSDTYYFLSKRTWFHLPLSALAFLSGVFYLSSQTNKKSRTRTFKRAAEFLSRSGKSVFLTPEGKMVQTGQIGSFNKGAFHLALKLKRPVVCVYIDARDHSGKKNYGLKGPLKLRLYYFNVTNPPETDINENSIDDLRKYHMNLYKTFESRSDLIFN
ncbi:MAG TPA: lysophospholipid acyltransferase family protein [Oligoflexia bacterium]|nr:lysophospholipid acyltransferase family protein [Oligoflexia bacterium]HMP47618.1 lysophospholipid acyltransferase family protein [Oligoflexia bacterium]